MTAASKENVTQILQAWSSGNQKAFDELFSIVYKELHRIAAAYMRRERPTHTLQPTALINEAYLKLVDKPTMNWRNRAHFYAVAAKIMRRILIDHAREHAAQKRGGGNEKLALEEGLVHEEERDVDLVKLDEALSAFEKIDPEKSRIIELRFFGGLSIEETAEVLSISASTVKRDWRTARAWLRRSLD
jgi:RNA polymerase sigma factor (TIGR02999 family)